MSAHDLGPEDDEVLARVAEWVSDRLMNRAVPIHARREELAEITREGSGAAAAWTALREVVLPAAFPTDHPRYLAFVGGAPTTASVLADVAMSAAAVYGGSELEAGAVVEAESAALRWLCSLIGYPADAHGAFVSGGSAANLSALVAARHGRASSTGQPPNILVVGASAHSSIRSAAEIMGCRIAVAGAEDSPMTAADLESVLSGLDSRDVVAVVATAGATNTGHVDELDAVAAVCDGRGIWLHVDAAYGGAALLSATCRSAFDGMERADSVTIDPHKWLFTPLDCAAVLYRNPELPRAAHRQNAHYLEAAHSEGSNNPSDFAVHLTRRARGIPLWASLIANGTDAYVAGVERCLTLASYAAKRIDSTDQLEVALEPQLSVVLFRREGWTAEEYIRWSREARRTGLALVTPTSLRSEIVLRLCFVNPLTTEEDIDVVLDSLVRTNPPAQKRKP